jgi:hypothetical protein
MSHLLARVERGMSRGETVLLHDGDRASATGSWRQTLAATEDLHDQWDARSLVAPLAEHRRAT